MTVLPFSSVYVPSVAADSDSFPFSSTTMNLTESVTTLPSFISKTIFEAISYPSGAAVSVRVYIPSGRFLSSLASFSVVQVIVFLSSESIVESLTFSELNSISFELFTSFVFPVSVSVAPGSSSPPPTAVLLITTSLVNKESNIVTTAGLVPSAGVTDSSAPFTTPFSIENSIFEEISYPYGAAFSVSVYFPSGRFLISVGSLPELKNIKSFVYTIEAFVSLTLSSLKIIVSPFKSFPVRCNSAPGSSSPLPSDFLLILTFVLYTSSNTVTTAGLSPSAGFTVFIALDDTTPFSIINVTAEVTLYP